MARCGCNNTCNCLVQACDGGGITVSGSGTKAKPYEICICLSTDENNVAEFGSDGCLYVPQTAFTVLDTATVDHTLTGTGTTTDPYILQSDVILTPDDEVPNPDGLDPSENLIKLGDGPGQGIYVSCEDVQDCVGQMVTALLDGIRYDDAGNAVMVEVSADAGNQIIYSPNDGGLYTNADGSETIVTPGPGGTVTGTGTAGDPYVVAPCISTDADNTLVLGTDGCLFVPGGLPVSGTDAAGNPAACDPAASLTFESLAPDCLPLTIEQTDCPDPVVRLGLNIAPDVCVPNILECTPNGLQVIPRSGGLRLTGFDTAVSVGGADGVLESPFPFDAGDIDSDTSMGLLTLLPNGCVQVNCDGLELDVHAQFNLADVDAGSNFTRLNLRPTLNGANIVSTDRQDTDGNLSLAPGDGPEVAASGRVVANNGDIICLNGQAGVSAGDTVTTIARLMISIAGVSFP